MQWACGKGPKERRQVGVSRWQAGGAAKGVVGRCAYQAVP